MNEGTLLLRQVHPAFIQNGRVSSQAFRPTPKDQDRLSVYNGDMITPLAAWQHYSSTLMLASNGVMGVTVAECSSLALHVAADPTPFPEHVLIDFSAHNRKQTERAAKLLRGMAEQRDWLYRQSHAS